MARRNEELQSINDEIVRPPARTGTQQGRLQSINEDMQTVSQLKTEARSRSRGTAT